MLFSILWTGHLRSVQTLFCPISLLILPDSSNYSVEGQQHKSVNRKCPCFAFANTSLLCCVSFWLVLLWFGRKNHDIHRRISVIILAGNKYPVSVCFHIQTGRPNFLPTSEFCQANRKISMSAFLSEQLLTMSPPYIHLPHTAHLHFIGCFNLHSLFGSEFWPASMWYFEISCDSCANAQTLPSIPKLSGSRRKKQTVLIELIGVLKKVISVHCWARVGTLQNMTASCWFHPDNRVTNKAGNSVCQLTRGQRIHIWHL